MMNLEKPKREDREDKENESRKEEIQKLVDATIKMDKMKLPTIFCFPRSLKRKIEEIEDYGEYGGFKDQKERELVAEHLRLSSPNRLFLIEGVICLNFLDETEVLSEKHLPKRERETRPPWEWSV